MNRLLLILLIVASVTGCANLAPVADKDRTFDIVVEISGIPKDQIFNSTKAWIAENFHSAKAVIEYENKEEGALIGNGIVPYPCRGIDCIAKSDWTVPFTMRVDMKEQRFRLTFSNIGLSIPPSYNSTFGAMRGHDGPIGMQSDLDAVKPKLLAFGDEIAKSIRNNIASKNW